MKKGYRFLSIIALIVLAAIIGFSMAACNGDSGGGGYEGLGDTINWTGLDVTNTSGITDFGYIEDHDYGGISPLSTFLNGTNVVTISGGKLTILLGSPKSMYLEYLDMDDFASDISAKGFFIRNFYGSDGVDDYFLSCQKDEDNVACLVYVDKDVTLNGLFDDDDPSVTIWRYLFFDNVKLKAGWNFMIESLDWGTDTIIWTSKTPDSSYKWVVKESD